MSFGLTTGGFVPKRLEDIKADLEAAFTEEFGVVNTTPESVIGQWIGIFSRLFAELWEQCELVYSAQYPSTAQGVALDKVVQLNGITRNPATKSSVVLQLMTTNVDSPPLIPEETTFQLQGTDTLVDLAEQTQISNAALQRLVLEVTGVAAGTYSFNIDGTTVDYVAAGTESEEDIAAQLKVDFDGSALAAYMTATLNGAVLTIDHDDPTDAANTFTLVDVDSPGAPATPELERNEYWTPGPGQAQEVGSIALPANGVTQIVDSVTDLDAVDNFAAGTNGRDPETDAELRDRREQSVQTAGGATLSAIKQAIEATEDTTLAKVFENDGDTVDGDGRPPHSLELVVDGPRGAPGSEWRQLIGTTLFDVKPAGIQTFGSESEDVVDSNGDTQVVYFNYPTAIDIHIIVDYTLSTDPGEAFPTDGEDQIKAKLVEYFGALELGQDVVFQKLFAPIYEVPGIADVDLYIREGQAPTKTPTYQVNIQVDEREIATTATGDIDVTDVTP